MTYAMIDIETLSKRPDACVISVGVAFFNDIEVTDTAGWAIRHQDWHGHLDPDTIAWWMKQNEAAREFSFKGTWIDSSVGYELKGLIDRHQPKEWWANDPNFDLVILEQWWQRVNTKGYGSLGIGPWPIHYRTPRSFRTIVGEAVRLGHDPRSESGTYVAHNPIDDAASQARVVLAARRMLSGRP